MNPTYSLDKAALATELRRQLQSALEEEEIYAVLRRFKKAQWQLVQDAEQKMGLPELFQVLTDIAELILQGATEQAQTDLAKRMPLPDTPCAIIAMGKFGGQELTYGSDLDLIFLYEHLDHQEFFVRFLQRIISLMGLVTVDGYAYKIDTELRPSGRTGVLVSTFESFRDYHAQQAKLWEQQALIKARPLGNTPFSEQIQTFVRQVVYQPREPKIALEISHLRHRMEQELARERPGQYHIKLGPGGIVDIEFLVQYLQLLHGCDHPELRTPQTLVALEALTGRFLPPEETKFLAETYLFYRQLETRLRQMTGLATDIIIKGSRLVSEIEERHFPALGGKMLDFFLQSREDVRKIYQRVMHDLF